MGHESRFMKLSTEHKRNKWLDSIEELVCHDLLGLDFECFLGVLDILVM